MLGYLMTLSDIFGLTMLLGLDSLAVTGSMLMFYGMCVSASTPHKQSSVLSLSPLV
jgi:hypothetical protein